MKRMSKGGLEGWEQRGLVTFHHPTPGPLHVQGLMQASSWPLSPWISDRLCLPQPDLIKITSPLPCSVHSASRLSEGCDCWFRGWLPTCPEDKAPLCSFLHLIARACRGSGSGWTADKCYWVSEWLSEWMSEWVCGPLVCFSLWRNRKESPLRESWVEKSCQILTSFEKGKRGEK